MIGQTISHYKITEELGRGGMGVVYKANDTKLNRAVALKFLPAHAKDEDEERARFLQEAQAAAALNHPNICTIYRVDSADGHEFIEMELVEGTNIRKKVPLASTADAIEYAIQIAEALQEAHNKGIVHRDIKADNIMVNNRNQIKVMDFGLARLKGSARLTKDSSTIGTLAYMAPEQIQAGDVDNRSDIFSFGVLLFEMLTGRLPFRGDHDAALMYSVLNEEPADLNDLVPGISPGLSKVVTRAIEKDPAARFQSAAEMIRELKVLQGDPAGARSPAPQPSAENIRMKNEEGGAWHKRNRSLFAAMLVILGGLAILWFNVRQDTPSGQVFSSLAVLPFVNETGDPDTEYLSDGMTEALINSLSKLPDVTVMSRSSVFRFKGSDIDPQKAGEELGVDAVMTGRIKQRGEDLTISAELARVADNSHIWGEVFNRNISEILSVQSELAMKISQELRTTMSGEDENRIARQHTENPEAYQYYLKGRYFWNKRTVDGTRKAIDYFNQAVDADPAYSLAYAGLADAYIILGGYNAVAPSDAFPAARAAAEKALEIDPSLAEAHASQGDIEIHYGWDWDKADRELQLAIQNAPAYATAHHWYGEYLFAVGRYDEAIGHARRASELDPLSPIISTYVGWNYYMARDYQTARIEFEKTIELTPDFSWARAYFAGTLEQLGMMEEMIRELERARDLYDHPAILSRLAYGYGVAGRREEAEAILSNLIAASENQYMSPHYIAMIHHGLGDRDQAFFWLEKSAQDRSPTLFMLRSDPMWDPIREDSRFVAIVRKMGLGG